MWNLTDGPSGVEPIELRHHDVHQNDVDIRRVMEDLNRIPSGLRREYMHIIPLQHARKSENVADIVVHDQHALAIEHRVVFMKLLQDFALLVGESRDGPK